MTTKRRRSLARPARILIVDDHPMMRAGLAAQIEDEPDLEVCAQAEDVNDALAAVKSSSPDLAIIDIALKVDHGIDLVKHIKSRFPGVKMLVLSAYQESLYAERALRAGAMGYLNKQETGEKIFEAIRTVLAGERYLSSEMTQRLVGRAFGAADATMTSPVESLSNRELEVFQLIGEGLTAAAIARRLHVSPHTIDSHREKIKQKLDVKTANEIQREATQWMLENG
jgi:DNA-binding NarL/FixJ family response regulator